MEREQLVKIVTAAQNGDADAMNTLFNTFYEDVHYFAYKTVKDETLAQDITQEAFIEILNTLGSLKEPAAFITWMKQITYHQCTRYFKKKKDVIVDEDEEGHSIFDNVAEENAEFIPGAVLDQQDFRSTIMGIIDELSEEQRSATMMYYFDELSIKEIAEIQGVSEGTIKSRLNYARKSIKASVEDYEKKHDIKLHGVGGLAMFPLMKWLMAGAAKGLLPLSTAANIAQGVTAATGAAITATSAAASAAAAATATATAATGISAKVVASIVAATIAVGGGTAAVIITTKDGPSSPAMNQSTSSTESIYSSSEIESNVSEIVSQYTGNGIEKLSGGHFEIVEIVPQGATLYCADGSKLTAGQALPKELKQGDALVYKDYVYGYECTAFYDGETLKTSPYENIGEYSHGTIGAEYAAGSWFVRVKDTSLASYTTFASKIGGRAVANMYNTYAYCTALSDLSAIKIPRTVRTMPHAFAGDPLEGSAITDASGLVIPSSVVVIDGAFTDCFSLEKAPTIPKNVKSMKGAFSFCSALTGDIKIEAFPTEVSGCFSLTDKPINLVGNSAALGKLAATNTTNNITVNGAEPQEVITAFLEKKIENYRKAMEHAKPYNFTAQNLSAADAATFTLNYLCGNGLRWDTAARQYKTTQGTFNSNMNSIFGKVFPVGEINSSFTAQGKSYSVEVNGNYLYFDYDLPLDATATTEGYTKLADGRYEVTYSVVRHYISGSSMVDDPYFTARVVLVRDGNTTNWKVESISSAEN